MSLFLNLIGRCSPLRNIVNYRLLPKETLYRCPGCKADSKLYSTPFAMLDRYGFSVSSSWCKSCNLIYINPRPTPNAYKHFYRTGQYRRLISVFSSREEDHLLPQARVDQLVSILKNHLPNRPISVLNIGGTPADYQSLSHHITFSRYVCLNPGEDEAGTGYEIWPYTLESLIETNEYFDLICLFGTINHLSEPGDSFIKIARMMRPESIFAFDFKDPLVKMSRITQPIGALQFDHATYPTLYTLGLLTKQAGLSLSYWHTANKRVYTFISQLDSDSPIPEVFSPEQSSILDHLRLRARRVPIRLLFMTLYSIFRAKR
jgi:hypothetical protein